MKKYLLCFALSIGIPSVWAESLTPEQALARLNEEIANSSSATGLQRAPISNLQLKETISGPAQRPAVYVFSGNGNSLVFVGADDVAEPMLGYTDGEVAGELPPQMQWWLSQYAAQIEHASAKAATAASHPAASANPDMATPRPAAATIYPYISTIVATRWNQSTPYNNLCPTVSGTKCYTGCTATATAQVMKYFNYPAKGSGTKTYTPNQNTSSTSGLYTSTLSLDMSTVTFDWNNMLNNYETESYTTAQANAVATLMKAVGYAAEMNYGTAASGASIQTALEGLKEYFGYNEAAVCLQRDNFSRAAWEKMVYDNLKNVGPVLYCGFNLTSAGHSFVCDGYVNGYFHFNWGWGGYCDGYFKLTALTPAGEGIGGNGSGDYSFEQAACFNITRPDAYVNPIEVASFAANGNLIASIDGNTLTITTDASHPFAALNQSGSAQTVTLGIKIVGPDNSVSYQSWIYAPSELPAGYGFNSVEVMLNRAPLSTLADGTYKLYLVAKTSTETEYSPVSIPVGNSDYIELTVANGSYSVASIPAPKLTISNFNVETSLYLFTDFKISYDVANNSQTEVIDGIQPVIYTKPNNAPSMRAATTDATINRLAVGDGKFYDLTAGESSSTTQTSAMTCYTSSVPSGQVYIGLRSNNTGEILAEKAVTLKSMPTAGSLTLQSFTFDGTTSNANASKITFNVGVKCSSGYYANPVYVYIYPSTGNSSVTNVTTSNLFLDANQSTVAQASGRFLDAEIGTTYRAYPFQKVNNTLKQLGSQYITFTVTHSVSGIDIVENDAEDEDGISVGVDRQSAMLLVVAPSAIAAVEVYTLDGRLALADADIDGNSASASLTAIPSGILLVKTTLTDGTTSAVKVAR